MPHLIVRNAKEEDILKVWDASKEEMQTHCDCPEDWFTVELANTKTLTPDVPVFVIIKWFERKGVKEKIAKLLTSKFNELDYSNVTIIFEGIKKEDYFENGQGF